MSIQVESLSHVYPSRIEAVRDVSLEISKGELLAIMGENGAGKTTLVKHFNGLLKPTRGRVLINGADTRPLHVAKLSRSVGMVFQNPDHQLFAGSVYEEIAFGLRRFKLYKLQMKQRIREVSERMEIGNLLDLSPYDLSVGDRRRVAFACVLAWNPEIIILDEPTLGQDAVLKESLKRLIRELHAEAKTIIMISHDVEFVAELKPLVVLMRQGEIVAGGPAERILTAPAAVRSASLLLPQVTQILSAYDEKRVHNILDVEAAVSLITKGES